MGDADVVSIAELVDERRYLLAVAGHMLGCDSGAEDGGGPRSVVDDTYREWYTLSDAERGRIAEPRSWLARTVGAICLSRLVDDSAAAEEAVGRALAAALESPPPAAGRARPGPADARPGSRPAPEHGPDAVVHALRRAFEDGDADGLEALLAPDATALFDGGGKVRTRTGPVHGGRQVARSLLALLPPRPDTALTPHSVNGRTGLIVRYHDHVAAVISAGVADRRVTRVWVVLNPDKLRSWNRKTPS